MTFDEKGPYERLPVEPWHQEEAQRRAEELDRNPEIALTREELWKQVEDERD
jgi:hypothetical protein